ncbi:MAG: hypothetical protein ACO1NU_04870 [Arcticibacter sp.]
MENNEKDPNLNNGVKGHPDPSVDVPSEIETVTPDTENGGMEHLSAHKGSENEAPASDSASTKGSASESQASEEPASGSTTSEAEPQSENEESGKEEQAEPKESGEKDTRDDVETVSP